MQRSVEPNPCLYHKGSRPSYVVTSFRFNYTFMRQYFKSPEYVTVLFVFPQWYIDYIVAITNVCLTHGDEKDECSEAFIGVLL